MGRPQGPEQFAVLALKCRPGHVLARAYHRPAMEEALFAPSIRPSLSRTKSL